MALKLKGSTSGFVAIDSPSVAGNNTLTLPENNGSAFQLFANDITAGVTTFTQVTVSRNGDLTVPGTISIGGTLTYEDVTNVDSIGVITARTNIYLGDSIFHNGDANTRIRFPAVDTFTVETAGSERLRVKSNGLVGIGTDNADTLLHLYGEGSTQKLLTFSSGPTKRNNYIGVAGADNLEIAVDEDNEGSDSTLRFRIDGGEKARITSSGAVGIATDAPASPLHIGQSTDDSVTAGITLKNNPSIGAQRWTLYNEENVGTHYNSNDGGSGRAHIFETNGTERLRIDSSGAVLINGTALSDVHTNADDVIIGNTSASLMGLSLVTGTSGYATLQFSDGAGNKNQGQIAYNHADDSMALTTAENVRLRIDSGGRVIINNTNNTNAHTQSDDLIVGNTSHGHDTGVTIVSNPSYSGWLAFSDGTSASDQRKASIVYQHSSDSLFLRNNGNQNRLIINATGDSTFAGIVTTTTGQFVTPNETGSLASRNRIDNGAMEISQRGGAEITINSGTEQILIDRWRARGEGGGPAFLLDQDSSAPYGFKSCLKFNCSTTGSGANSIFTITQNIEGYNIADFGFGGGNARDIAVSFWVKSSLTGDFGGSLQNSAQNRSYPFVYNIGSADSWEYKTILIPGPTSGTWLNENTIGLKLNFDMGCGSSFRGNAGSWNSADDRGPSGAVSPMQTQNSVWRVTGVQVEMGPAATPFEYRGFSQELLRCCRHFWRSEGRFTAAARGAGSSAYLASIATPVPLRAEPTISSGNSSNGNGNFNIRVYEYDGVSDSAQTPTVGTRGWTYNNPHITIAQGGHSVVDDRVITIYQGGGYLDFSSEL